MNIIEIDGDQKSLYENNKHPKAPAMIVGAACGAILGGFPIIGAGLTGVMGTCLARNVGSSLTGTAVGEGILKTSQILPDSVNKFFDLIDVNQLDSNEGCI